MNPPKKMARKDSVRESALRDTLMEVVILGPKGRDEFFYRPICGDAFEEELRGLQGAFDGNIRLTEPRSTQKTIIVVARGQFDSNLVRPREYTATDADARGSRINGSE